MEPFTACIKVHYNMTSPRCVHKCMRWQCCSVFFIHGFRQYVIWHSPPPSLSEPRIAYSYLSLQLKLTPQRLSNLLCLLPTAHPPFHLSWREFLKRLVLSDTNGQVVCKVKINTPQSDHADKLFSQTIDRLSFLFFVSFQTRNQPFSHERASERVFKS